MGIVKFFNKLSDLLDKTCEVVIVIMLALMVVISGAQIICRTLFTALSWSDEATRYLLVWSSFLGAGCVYKHGGHINITFVQDLLPKAPRRALQIFVQAACIALFAVMIVFGMKYYAKQGNQLSAAMRIPMRYVYLCIPLGGAFMLVHAVNEILQLLFGKEAI